MLSHFTPNPHPQPLPMAAEAWHSLCQSQSESPQYPEIEDLRASINNLLGRIVGLYNGTMVRLPLRGAQKQV